MAAELRALALPERTAKVQQIVVALAGEVMGRADVPTDESLMDAGMDSLGAMEFRNALAAKMGVPLPDTMMFDFPTIAGISSYIAEQISGAAGSEKEASGTSTVLQLSPGTPGSAVAPVFCVQGAGRGDFLYKEVAKQLGTEQPFYELRFSGLAFATVSELAAHFVAEITKIVPRGTVVLAGWSFGGLVAYEIAQQLAAVRGPRVTQLVLIDWVEAGMAHAAGHNSEIGAVGALVRSVELGAGRKLPDAMLDAAVQRIATLPLDTKIAEAIKLLEENDLLRSVDQNTRAELGESVKSFEHAIASMMRHNGQTTAAAVSAFAAKERVRVLALSSSKFGLHQMARFDWSGCGPEVETATIDGDHWELLRGSAVEALGSRIRTFLTSTKNVAASMLSATDSELAELIASLQTELASRR